VGWVNDLSLRELKSLDAGLHFGADFAGVTIPTLEEVLDLVGDRLLVNIELKAQIRHHHDLEFAVGSLVQRMGLKDRVWISSFKPYTLSTMRWLATQQHISALLNGILYAPLNWGTFFLAPITPFEALHPHFSLVRRWQVTVAHALGLKVFVWTVDDVTIARKLVADGVDGIITNVPGALIEKLHLS
jgi:glycerophosphoryl diester phosphodiesterase